MGTTTILGANGKLGRILAHFASRTGVGWRTQARVGTPDVLWSGRFDDATTKQIFTKGATLINMIGHTGTDETLLQDTNVRFVKDLLHTAAEAGVAHVVLASSAAVYGAGRGEPFLEDAHKQPITPYAKSKAAMEAVAQTFAAGKVAPAITILRIGNVAGADALMTSARRHTALGRPMPLHRFADGSVPVRSYIGPDDLFDAILALSAPHDGPPRIFNVAHPQPVPLDGILNAYRSDVLPDLRWIDTPAPDHTPNRVTLSADKVQHFVNFDEYNNNATAMARQVAGLPGR